MKKICFRLFLAGVLLAGTVPARAADSTQELTATQWIEKGLSLNDNSEEETACYQQALVLEPDNARAHENLAHVCHARGQLGEALEHFQRAAKIDPARVEAWYNTSVLLWKVRRDAVDARQAMSRYLEAARRIGGEDLKSAQQAQASIDEYESIISQQLHPAMIELYFGQGSPAAMTPARIVVASEIVAILSRPRWREGDPADASPEENLGKGRYDGPCFPLLLFAKGSSTLNGASAQAQLRELLKALRDPMLAAGEFLVIGHTDNSGACAANLRLAERRAQMVVQWLKAHGCQNGLKPQALGEDLPAYPNTSLLHRRLNRRVEIYRVE
jgi:flagellar motor protein MotB